MRLDAIFVGERQILMPEGQPTGIFKTRVSDAVRVEREGIPEDYHGDLRVHGGPDKALHHYAAENYERLAQAFPAAREALVPGALGENLSANGMNEHSVLIGDSYRIGTCTLQVSQPRSPCWKINHRFGEERMSYFVESERITGWYYRVLETGELREGDYFDLVEREEGAPSIAEFVALTRQHRPATGALEKLSALSGLAANWRERLARRSEWLRRNQ